MICIKIGMLSALMRMASTDENRVTLNGVYFDSTGFAVATDGPAMMVCRIPTFVGPSFRVGLAVLAAKIKARKANKSMVKVRLESSILIEATDATDYPPWRLVYPKTISLEPAQFDSAILERALRALRDLTGEKLTAPLEMLPNGDSAGFVVTNEPDVSIVVMPFRTSDQYTQAGAKVKALGFLENNKA